jgi:hypothetical protein
MFRVLPGPMFAAVQSKLFPMYFNFQVVCFLHVSLCWLVRYGSNGQTMNLAVGLLASVLNFGILGPLQVCVTLCVPSFAVFRRGSAGCCARAPLLNHQRERLDVGLACRKALAARTKAERSQEEAKTEAEKSRATSAYLAAKQRFGKLHGMSMLANFVVVGVLCWHLVVVGGGIF